MDWEITSAKYLDGHRLRLTFVDGKSGVVDFERYIRKGGVFTRLADVEYFKNFHINPDFGVICWGNDLDIAPERLFISKPSANPPAL